MKKVIFGGLAVVAALIGVATTKAQATTFTGTYYFQIVSGDAVTPATLPPSSPSGTWGCTGGLTVCAKAYSSYSFNASTLHYHPVGAPIATTFKN